MWLMHDGWGWWMIFGGIWMLLLWIAIIWLVVWGIRSLTRHREPREGTPEKRDALDIAKERYAKGQISKEEFEQIKRDLS